MGLTWTRENPPHWDEEKAAIVGGAPAGIFELPNYKPGDVLPGEWWRVEDEAGVAGYGWMDTVWGDAEILLAVAPTRQKQGVGSFILDHLEEEARARGLNHLYNSVRPTHPERERVTRFLESRRFKPSRDGVILRRVVAAKK